MFRHHDCDTGTTTNHATRAEAKAMSKGEPGRWLRGRDEQGNEWLERADPNDRDLFALCWDAKDDDAIRAAFGDWAFGE